MDNVTYLLLLIRQGKGKEKERMLVPYRNVGTVTDKSAPPSPKPKNKSPCHGMRLLIDRWRKKKKEKAGHAVDDRPTRSSTQSLLRHHATYQSIAEHILPFSWL